MEKIKKYVENFFKRTPIRDGYDMPMQVWRALTVQAEEHPSDATGNSFLYGYAKGYRAAMAEMKKGGAA